MSIISKIKELIVYYNYTLEKENLIQSKVTSNDFSLKNCFSWSTWS